MRKVGILAWELADALTPWSEPRADLSGFPYASGSLLLPGYDRDNSGKRIAAPVPSSPVTVPPSPLGSPHVILRFATVGAAGAYISIAYQIDPEPRAPELDYVEDPDHAIAIIDSTPILVVSAQTPRIIRVRPGDRFVAVVID